MLNYIWGGLIVSSLVFALVTDIGDLTSDTYRNGDALPVEIGFPQGFQPDARRQTVEIRIDPATYQAFYATAAQPAELYSGVLLTSREGREVRFARDVSLPEPLATIRDFTAKRDDELLANVSLRADPGASSTTGSVVFRSVEFVKMNAIGAAAFEFAEAAVTLALGLIGVLALWLGLLRIGEKAGLIEGLVRLVRPVFRPIFPEIPKDHPAMGVIALYMTANVLGLNNAATPLGIKAMESLQELNPDPETATNDQVTLLALATGSVQLVPPTLLVAVMGLQVNELVFGIIIATLVSTTCGVIAAKVLAKTRWYRTSNPMLAAADNVQSPTGGTPPISP